MKIPLFDLDKTLITGSNKIHGQAFEAAFSQVYGIANAKISDISTSGKIDSQIINEILTKHGIAQQDILEGLPAAFTLMAEFFLTHTHYHDYTLTPGARDLLTVLSNAKIPLGLLTGNVETIARRKLELLGIADFFSFGAFGNLAHRRPDLVLIAYENAKANNVRINSIHDLVIVGDTPLDIACALEASIASVGVATGDFSMEDLQKTGANLVVPNLVNSQRILSFLSAAS